jgi:O-antigen ligase
VGIANASHSQELLRFELSGVQVQIKHFHNFLIDAWYETGILGVGLLLALVGTVFVRLARILAAAAGRRSSARWDIAGGGTLDHRCRSAELFLYLPAVCLLPLRLPGWVDPLRPAARRRG